MMPIAVDADSTRMMRFLAAIALLVSMLTPSAECGLFSRKKKPQPVKYGVSRASQQRRTEKAMIQQQKNREKQKRQNARARKSNSKPVEVRVKASPTEGGN